MIVSTFSLLNLFDFPHKLAHVFSCFVIELDPGYRVYELDAGLWWLLFLLYCPVPHFPVKQLFNQSEFNLQSYDRSNSVLVLFLGEWAELEFLGGNRCSS